MRMKYSTEEKLELEKTMSDKEKMWVQSYGYDYKNNPNWVSHMEDEKRCDEWNRIVELYISDNWNEKYFGEHSKSYGRGMFDGEYMVSQDIYFDEKYIRLRKDKKTEILKDTFKIENDLGLRIEHCWNKYGGSYVRIDMKYSELVKMVEK